MRLAAVISLVVASLLGLAAPAGAAEDVTCYRDWSTASEIVRTEGLVTVDRLVAEAPERLGGDIVRTILCRAERGYFYRLVIRDQAGQLRGVIVDAKRPFKP
jgi:hypothetical protein